MWASVSSRLSRSRPATTGSSTRSSGSANKARRARSGSKASGRYSNSGSCSHPELRNSSQAWSPLTGVTWSKNPNEPATSESPRSTSSAAGSSDWRPRSAGEAPVAARAVRRRAGASAARTRLSTRG